MVRRKKGESLTDLAQEIRRLMVLAFPGPTDRTTDMVARVVFIEALEDQDLVNQVQAQRPTNLDSALQVEQHMEAVMRTVTSRSSKAVRAVVQDTIDPRVAAALKELKAGQKYLLELLQQLIAEQARRAEDGPGGERSSEIDSGRNVARRGVGTVGARRTARGTGCFVVGVMDILPETATSLD